MISAAWNETLAEFTVTEEVRAKKKIKLMKINNFNHHQKTNRLQLKLYHLIIYFDLNAPLCFQH